MQPPLLRPRQVPTHTVGQIMQVVDQWGCSASLAQGGQEVELTGLTLASSRVAPGDLYVALAGARAHGADFALHAVQQGARAVLTDAQAAQRLAVQPTLGSVPVIVVEDPRGVLGRLSAWMYDHPARDLRMVAVTGTNGKTTTSYMIDTCLRQAGWSTGLIGTIESRLATQTSSQAYPSARTTPEAPDLHALLALMREQGAQAVVMEVSSHALCLGRVDGVTFDVAVFTNLSQDHLDFHSTMEQYFAAKASLFTAQRCRAGVVCVDDAWGQRLAKHRVLPMTTYTTQATGSADWRVEQVQLQPTCSHLQVQPPDAQPWQTQVGLPGQFNVANALAAAIVCDRLEVPISAVQQGLAGARVPGRMENIQLQPELAEVGQVQDVGVLVDYAHTPDAVATALQAIRSAAPARVWCVLGCGGDRDATKRPLMGQAAAMGADEVVVTDDNPRSEDPASIRAAVLHGARSAGSRAHIVEIADREQAITHAIAHAQTGDVVAILGKGHERGQETRSGVQPFDDRQVAMSAVQHRFSGSSGLPQSGQAG